MYGNLGKVYS